MMGRRGMLAGMAMAGGLPLRRIDQRAGLEGHRAGVGPAPSTPFVVARRVIIVGPSSSGLFVYFPAAGPNELVASISGGTFTDPVSGQTVRPNIASYQPSDGTAVSLVNAGVAFWGGTGTLITVGGLIIQLDATSVSARPELLIRTGIVSGGQAGTIQLFGRSSDLTGQPQILMAPTGSGGTSPVTTAMAEVQGITGGTTMALIPAAATDNAFESILSGDARARIKMDGNGQFQWGDGTNPQDVDLLRPSANLLRLSISDFQVHTAGRGLQVAEGSNAKQGTATLAAGTVVVANTSVTANSRIMLTAQDNNSTGALRVSARTAGTSFTITSSNAADTGVVAYEIFEPG